MKRRDFLKSVSGLAAGAMVPAPAIWSSAKADARSETLLIVSEGGPNNLDIHGVGTNVPGYEVSWNCYDRLISHEMKSGPGGVPYYDRDKFKGELAEATVEYLRPFQDRVKHYTEEDLGEILRNGADKARAIASATLADVYHKTGIK